MLLNMLIGCILGANWVPLGADWCLQSDVMTDPLRSSGTTAGRWCSPPCSRSPGSSSRSSYSTGSAPARATPVGRWHDCLSCPPPRLPSCSNAITARRLNVLAHPCPSWIHHTSYHHRYHHRYHHTIIPSYHHQIYHHNNIITT